MMDLSLVGFEVSYHRVPLFLSHVHTPSLIVVIPPFVAMETAPIIPCLVLYSE